MNEQDRRFDEFLSIHERELEAIKVLKELTNQPIVNAEKEKIEFEKEFIKFEDKYVMIKIEDIKKYIPEELQYHLRLMLLKIMNGRVKDGKPRSNDYIVCNQDEAYAKEVWEIIKHGEAIKHMNLKQT